MQDKNAHRQQTEQIYVDAVKVCNDVEKEYDTKMTSNLNRSQNVELERLTGEKERLTKLYTLWKNVCERCKELNRNE